MTPHRRRSVLEFPSELEIVQTRDFEAPIQLVFDVFTKEEHVRRTIAPFDEQVTVCSIDLRVGGDYHYVFVTEDGYECSFRGHLPRSRPAHPVRPDVALRRVAGCRGRRVDGPAGG